jgi:DNA-binding protein WhiA
MSFAVTVKEDLLKVDTSDRAENMALLEALFRFGGEVVISFPVRLRFTCNNMALVRHIVKVCKMYYDIEYQIESRVIKRFDNKTVFTLEITKEADKIIKELELLIYESKLKKMELEENVMVSYLRGAFLVRGTVNDPMSKNSHLEISSSSDHEIIFLQRIVNSFELNARITKRKNNLVLYINSKEDIGDFLYRLGATSAMTYYEDVVITKEIKTTAKRTVNLELANQDKTNSAAVEQLKYIKYLEYHYPLGKLDPKLLMVMKVRKEHPESSLMELLEIINDNYEENLTKSGLNHRLRRIKEIALEHQQMALEKTSNH